MGLDFDSSNGYYRNPLEINGQSSKDFYGNVLE